MAANSLGRLTLDLVAKIGEFVGPMTQAEHKARDANKGIADSFNVASVAAKAFGAVVAGASVAGVAAFVDQTITAGNEVKKFSQLANASMSQFQYYAKGAETAGISMESFADKMKDMQDRIGDFQQTGGGPLADFFTNIAPLVGVTIQQFQKLSGPEAMQLYYDSLVKVGASQNDMKFYMEAIISDSSLLIPLLENGGAGFKKWGDAAQSAGAIMSDSMVNQLALAKENLQMLDLQWQGFQATLVNNVMPVVQTVADNFDTIKAVAMALGAAIATKLVLQMGMLTIEFVKGVIEGIRYQMTLAAMAGQTITLTTATVGLKTAMLGLVGGPGGLAVLAIQALAAGAAFLYMKNKSDEVKPSLDSQNISIQELTSSYEKLSDSAKRTQMRFENTKLSELGDEYDDAKSKLISYVIAMGRFDDSSDSAIQTANKLAMQYKQGDITAEQLASRINALTGASAESKEKIDAQAAAVGKAKTAMSDQEKVVESLSEKNAEIAKSNEKVTVSVNDQTQAWRNLAQKQREALTGIDTALQREQYVKVNMNAGWSRERAEYTADYRDKAGLGYTGKTLSPLELNKLSTGFNSQNYSFTKADLKAIAKVNGIAKANNFAQIEGLYGLPKGTLAALVLGESGGNANAISPTGAKGLFQTTSVFRKEYGLNSGSSVQAQASAAAQDIAKNLKSFGSLEKALMAYNAGAGGLSSYLKGGLSESKRKEVAGYVPKFSKYFAGVNGKSTVDQEFLAPSQETLLEQASSVEEALKTLNDKKLDLESKYYTESQALAEENRKAVESINETFGGDPKQLKTMLAKQAELFANQNAELEINKKAEYQSYFNFETDRITQITQSYDKEKSLIQTNTEYSKAQKKTLTDALERQKQQEIDAVKREEGQQVKSAFEAYMNETEIVLNRYKVERDEITKNYQLTKETREKLLQANSMGIFGEMNRASGEVSDREMQSREYLFQKTSPDAYAKWDLQNQYSSVSSDLFGSYGKDVSGAKAIEDEDKRNAELLAANERYLQAKAALNDEYAQREKDLGRSQYEEQLQLYSSLLSQAGSVWGDMTQIVKDSAGESSAIYKTMFLAQQAIAIGQAIINTEVGATAALKVDPTGFMSMMTRGLGYASVGLIASQTIAGMAHDGIDNIPKEGTWLLDKGERVVDSRTNSDLKNYLAEGGGSGGDVYYTQTIHIASDGSATSESDAKQLGKMMENMTLSIIRREQRQGGLLSR